MEIHERVDLPALTELAKEAGAIALGHFRNVKPERKADRTLVTAADREVEVFLRERLSKAYPDFGILGEEYGGFEEAGKHEAVWALDPIDGTAGFSMGLPVWGVSIGLLVRGQPRAGVVYLPKIDEVYSALCGEGAFFNGDSITMSRTMEPGRDDFLCTPSNTHRRYRITFRGKTRSFGSTAAHLVFPARNCSWGALIGRVHVWDIAGGASILQEAGGMLEYLRGQPVDFSELMDGRSVPDHILAGTRERIHQMRQWITAAD